MRLLLIDNGTLHLDELQTVCRKHDVATISAEALANTDTDGFEAFILSGSYKHAVMTEQEYYAAETALIRSTDKPLLGICLGFELLCSAYGSEVSQLNDMIHGAGVVQPTEAGSRIFQGTEPIRVTEAHRWYIDEVPHELIVLAESESGIEAVRHKKKVQYGLQFHPEDFTYSSDGKLVFDNILSIFQAYTRQQAKHRTSGQ